MENRPLLEDQPKVKCLEAYGRNIHPNMEGRPVSCSKCCEKVAEFACSACWFCVVCPLSIVWCCVVFPCRLACRAARCATQRTCCRSEKRILAAYSSFSDIDSNNLQGKSHPCIKESNAMKRRIAQKLPK